MNPVRERVLDDRKGFVTLGEETPLPDEQEITMLRGEVLKLRKKLKESNQFHEKQRDTTIIKMTDQVQKLERQVRELRRENDRAKQTVDKHGAVVDGYKQEIVLLKETVAQLEGQNMQLEKELMAVASPADEEKPKNKKK